MKAAKHLGVGSNTGPAPVGMRAKRVLIVDDHEDSETILMMLLKAKGHDVRLSRDGNEALQISASFNPNLVLLDLGLPGLDGYEVATRLRGRKEMDGTIIAAVSGFGGEPAREKSKHAGCDIHYTKPMDIESLDDLLSR